MIDLNENIDVALSYTADFETTTDKNDLRIWAWGICNIDDFTKNIFIKPNIKVTTNQLPSNPQNLILFFILPTSLSIHFWKYSNKFIIPETIQLADIIINAILQPLETLITKQNAYNAINANIIHIMVVIKRTLLFLMF